MKTLLRRFGITLLVVAVVFIVLRAIVVPLARQRQERRQLDPTLVALLPEGVESWILLRSPLRQPAPRVIPETADLIDRRLREWGLPDQALRSRLNLGKLMGGPWLVASLTDGDWVFAGRRSRLPWGGALSETLAAAADSLVQLPEGTLSLIGPYFIVTSRPELHGGPAWLDALPEWTELGDLLVGSDLLEYRRCGAGGALVGTKTILGTVLVEGLAWDCPEGEAALAAIAPGGDLPACVDGAALAELPLLRRGGPFGRSGLPLEATGMGLADEPERWAGERRWTGADCSAIARVLTPSAMEGK